MEHFIAYHSVKVMGYPLEKLGQLTFLSRKLGHLQKAIGNKVWIVSGTPGKGHTTYKLHGAYVAESIEELADGTYRIEGFDGVDLSNPVELNDLPWFNQLRQTQANFSLGFNRLGDRSIVEELEKLAGNGPRPRKTSEARVAQRTKQAVRQPTKKHGQGQGLTSREKRAVEAHAMKAALSHYRKTWKQVEDVSANEPYDLRCRDGKGRTLHVEVKGTTGTWRRIRITAAELEHARTFTLVAIFILHGIRVDRAGDKPVASGGKVKVIEPWDITRCEFRPLAYECTLFDE